MRFQDLKIDEAILKAIREIGYEEPTPIQEQAIAAVLAGRDLLGCRPAPERRRPSPFRCCSAWVRPYPARIVRCAA